MWYISNILLKYFSLHFGTNARGVDLNSACVTPLTFSIYSSAKHNIPLHFKIQCIYLNFLFANTLNSEFITSNIMFGVFGIPICDIRGLSRVACEIWIYTKRGSAEVQNINVWCVFQIWCKCELVEHIHICYYFNDVLSKRVGGSWVVIHSFGRNLANSVVWSSNVRNDLLF